MFTPHAHTQFPHLPYVPEHGLALPPALQPGGQLLHGLVPLSLGHKHRTRLQLAKTSLLRQQLQVGMTAIEYNSKEG